MGYLRCDSCQGYYELKTDESPEDFINKCECGGNLKYIESLDLEEESTGPEESHDSREHTEATKTFTLESSNAGEVPKSDTRIIRLALGVLIVLIPNFLFASSSNIIFFAFSGIPLILGGFISSIFIEKSEFKDGILNGARVGLFSGIIYLFISLIISVVYNAFPSNIASATGFFVLSFLLLILLTSIGGFLAIGTRQLILKLEKREGSKREKQVVEETAVVIETEALREIQEEETEYRDELVKLGYKQMSAINDGEKVFNCLLSDSISENDAIERLKDDQKVVYEVLAEMKKITPPERYREYHNLKMESSTDICKTFEIIDGLVKNDPTKIQKTNNLVENSTNKINQAITELHKTMWAEDAINECK